MLLLAGVSCVLVSIIGLRLAWEFYNLMATRPVPGPEPVARETGPAAGDVAVFVGIALFGVGGLLKVLLSTPWGKSSAESGAAAE